MINSNTKHQNECANTQFLEAVAPKIIWLFDCFSILEFFHVHTRVCLNNGISSVGQPASHPQLPKIIDNNTSNGGQASNGKKLLSSYRWSILYGSVQVTLRLVTFRAILRSKARLIHRHDIPGFRTAVRERARFISEYCRFWFGGILGHRFPSL